MLSKIRLSTNNKSDRSNIFFTNTFFNFLFIGLKIGVNLLIVPLLLTYLEGERYGIWQTIISIVSFVAVFNFGYPNGLRNLITRLLLSSSKINIGNVIGATYVKVSKLTLLTAIFIIPLIYFFLKPKNLFLETPIPSNEITYSLLIFIFFSLLNNILSLSDSIAFGYQKSYLTSFFQVCHLLMCYLIIYLIGKHLNLIYISLIFGATRSLGYVFFIIYQNQKFKININFNSNFLSNDINKVSFHFFLAHLLALFFLAIDNFIISSALGAEETTKFSIVNKIFFTLITFFSILLIHFWNSVTEAYEKKEFTWILKIIKVLYLISIVFFVMGLIISFYQKQIISFWLGENILELESLTFYLFSIYVFLHCINAIFQNLQNGLGMLKIQIYTSLFALSIYALGCYLIDIKLYGYNSIIMLKIGVMFLSVILNSLILKRIKE